MNVKNIIEIASGALVAYLLLTWAERATADASAPLPGEHSDYTVSPVTLAQGTDASGKVWV